MLDFGRPAAGPGYDYVRTVLREVLAGRTRHGGALLAPLAVRFVVAERDDLQGPALRRLVRQFDLNLVPAGGLIIFENSKWVPLASLVADPEWLQAAFAPTVESVAQLPTPHAEPLGLRPLSEPAVSDSLVLLSQQFDPRWRLTFASGAKPLEPRRAFGWAVAFVARPSGFTISFHGQQIRTLETGLLVILWLGVLWLSRKPATGA